MSCSDSETSVVDNAVVTNKEQKLKTQNRKKTDTRVKDFVKDDAKTKPNIEKNATLPIAGKKKDVAKKKVNTHQKSKSTKPAVAEKVAVKKAKPIPKKITKKKLVKKKPTKKKSLAQITFEEKEFNYGRIKPGDIVKHQFKFKNTGKADLIISNAVASCGCTTPSFPFIPIAPGEEGYIGVVFNSAGKLGKQRPSITLTTNVGTKKVYLMGYVYDQLSKQ